MIEGFLLIEGVFFSYPVRRHIPSNCRQLRGLCGRALVCRFCYDQLHFPPLGQTYAKVHAFGHISWRVFRKLWFHHMELEAEKGKETLVKKEVQNILAKENQRRAEIKRINWSGEEVGEAGIFCIYKSELLAEASSYIQGNRILFGSISAVLLIAGLMNFANVMLTSIIARKQDFLVMEKIGMTKRQKRKLLVMEGMYYVLIVAVLLLTVGVGMLYLISKSIK